MRHRRRAWAALAVAALFGWRLECTGFAAPAARCLAEK